MEKTSPLKTSIWNAVGPAETAEQEHGDEGSASLVGTTTENEVVCDVCMESRDRFVLMQNKRRSEVWCLSCYRRWWNA